MKVNILVGEKEVGEALSRYLRYVLKINNSKILFLEESVVSSEDLNADIWIVEVFTPFEFNNPVGFRTIYKLLKINSNLKFFLLFPPLFPEFLRDLPKEGPFWWSPCCLDTTLSKKIKEILSLNYSYKKEVETLAQRYPLLLYDPAKHHHHHH